MKEFTTEYKYKLAKEKAQNLRAFYIHVVGYILVNILIDVLKIIRNLNNGETLHQAIFDFATFGLWLVWGVGLLFHAFSVFGMDFIWGRHWETKKLKQFMDEETFSLNIIEKSNR